MTANTKVADWHNTVPRRPGLYWRSTRSKTQQWQTDLCWLGYYDFDSVVMVNVTPSRLDKPLVPPRQEIRYRGQVSDSEHFSEQIDVQPAPERTAIADPLTKPSEPGLYYFYFSRGLGSGWSSALVSMSIYNDWEDEAERDYTILLVDRKTVACMRDASNVSFGPRLEIVSPSNTPA